MNEDQIWNAALEAAARYVHAEHLHMMGLRKYCAVRERLVDGIRKMKRHQNAQVIDDKQEIFNPGEHGGYSD